MPIARITGQGLFAMGCSVALLWSCLIGERVMLRHADSERIQVLRQIEQLRLQPRPVPVSAPSASRRMLVTEA